MKYNVNNIDYEILNEIVLSIYNEHWKCLRSSHDNLVTKELQKGVIKRPSLRKTFLKKTNWSN